MGQLTWLSGPSRGPLGFCDRPATVVNPERRTREQDVAHEERQHGVDRGSMHGGVSLKGEQSMDDEQTVLLEWEVSARPGAEADARQLVAAAVAPQFPEDPRLHEDVALVTSELVTNAIRVALHRVAVRVTAERDTVTVSVTDDGPGEPRLRRPDPDDPTGRGLLLVEAVAQRWGVLRTDARTKTVWARSAVRR